MHGAMVFVSFEVLKAIRSPSRRFGREVAGFKNFEENMNAFEPVVTKAVATVFLVAQTISRFRQSRGLGGRYLAKPKTS